MDEIEKVEETENKKKNTRDKKAWIPIVIIAVVIVVVTLFITVWVVDDFKTIGDLFNFIGSQF